jgi:hypothetical protein
MKKAPDRSGAFFSAKAGRQHVKASEVANYKYQYFAM